MRVKLSIFVTPLAAQRDPANSLFPGPTGRLWHPPQESRQKFVHFIEGEATIGQLWAQIEEAYKNKYLTRDDFGQFAIKKLQDEHDNDLDIQFTVGELFEGEQGEKIIKVIQKYVNRADSVPATSTLRPAHLSVFKRPPLPPVPAFPSNKRRKIESEDNSSPFIDVHPDRPIRSRERSVIEHDGEGERAQEISKPRKRSGQLYQSATRFEDQEISDSEEEREREREHARINNTDLLHSNSISRQTSSLQQDSMQQNLELQGPAHQNEPVHISVSHKGNVSSEDEDDLENSEVEYQASPELEAPPDRHESTQNVFMNSELANASSRLLLPVVKSLSKSPKQSQSPQLLRNLPSQDSSLQEHANRRSPYNINVAPCKASDEHTHKTVVPSKPLTNGHLASYPEALKQPNIYAQHSHLNDLLSTPKSALNNTAGSVGHSTHTNISHADSPVHKVIDSQNANATTARRNLQHTLQASRAIDQGLNSSLKHYRSEVPKSSSTAPYARRGYEREQEHEHDHASKDENDDFVTKEHGFDHHMPESPQLLSTSPAVMRQLTTRHDKGLPEKTQRSSSIIKKSTDNWRGVESNAIRSPSLTEEHVTYASDKRLREPTQTTSINKTAHYASLPANRLRESQVSSLSTTSSQPHTYLDEEGNDHSSPMKRAKELSAGPVLEQSVRSQPISPAPACAQRRSLAKLPTAIDSEQAQRRSASEQRQLKAKASQDDDERTREYFRVEDERNRLLALGQIPEVRKTLSTAQVENVMEQNNVGNVKTRSARRARPGVNVELHQLNPIESAQHTSAQKQQMQLLERNRVMKEKELKNSGVKDTEMPDKEPTIADTSPPILKNQTSVNRTDVPTPKSLRRPTRDVTTLSQTKQRNNSETTNTGDSTMKSVEALRRSAVLNHRTQTSSVSSDEQVDVTSAGTESKSQKLAVVVDSPVELRRVRQSKAALTKQAQVQEVVQGLRPKSASRIDKSTPLSITEKLGNRNTKWRNQPAVSKMTEDSHDSSPDMVFDNHQAEAGPSKPSEKSKQFWPLVPDIPAKSTRQSKKSSGLTTKKDTPSEKGGKIQTRLNVLNTAINQPVKEIAKGMSKSSTMPVTDTSPNHRINTPDVDMYKVMEKSTPLRKDIRRTSSRILSQKGNTQKMKPMAHLPAFNDQTKRSLSLSSEKASLAHDEDGTNSEEEAGTAVAEELDDVGSSPKMLHAHSDRAPAQYIPSSASQSPVDDEPESNSSKLSSAIAPSEAAASHSSRAGSATSVSSAEGDIQTDTEASPVSTPAKQASSLDTDLDAALQRDAERSAISSSSLGRDHFDTQDTLMSQQIISPPPAERNETPDWATPKHLQVRKDTATYNSVSTKDLTANKPKDVPISATVTGISTDDLSESSEEPSSIEDDSDESGVDDENPNGRSANRRSPSMTLDQTPLNDYHGDVIQSRPGDLSSRAEKSGSTQSLFPIPTPTTKTPIPKVSNAPERRTTPYKTPAPGIRRTTSGLSLPKSTPTPVTTDPHTRDDPSSSSSESSSDGDSSHSSDEDSETERNIASNFANVPEGTMKDKAIKKMRRLAKFTRRVDRNPERERRKIGESQLYQGVGGKRKFEELARKWG